MMIPPVLCIAGTAYQTRENLALQLLGFCIVTLQLLPSGSKELTCYSCYTHLEYMWVTNVLFIN